MSDQEKMPTPSEFLAQLKQSDAPASHLSVADADSLDDLDLSDLDSGLWDEDKPAAEEDGVFTGDESDGEKLDNLLGRLDELIDDPADEVGTGGNGVGRPEDRRDRRFAGRDGRRFGRRSS